MDAMTDPNGTMGTRRRCFDLRRCTRGGKTPEGRMDEERYGGDEAATRRETDDAARDDRRRDTGSAIAVNSSSWDGI